MKKAKRLKHLEKPKNQVKIEPVSKSTPVPEKRSTQEHLDSVSNSKSTLCELRKDKNNLYKRKYEFLL